MNRLGGDWNQPDSAEQIKDCPCYANARAGNILYGPVTPDCHCICHELGLSHVGLVARIVREERQGRLVLEDDE